MADVDFPNLSGEFESRTGEQRPDLQDLDIVWLVYRLRDYRIRAADAAARETDGITLPDVATSTVHLFWSVWPLLSPGGESLEGQPRTEEEPVPPLPADLEEAFIERLTRLERALRVEYEPDHLTRHGPSSPDARSDLAASMHLAATRAFVLKTRHGYSDDVRDCLDYARRAGTWFGTASGSAHGLPALDVSTHAVYGLVLLELSHVRARDGDHEEALEFLTDSLLSLVDADRAAWAGFARESEEAQGSLYRIVLPRRVDLNAQEVVDILEQLFARPRQRDWKQIAGNCSTLSTLDASWRFSDLGINDDVVDVDADGIRWTSLGFAQTPFKIDDGVVDAEGIMWGFQEYLSRAEARAQERLRPDQLREYLEQKEDRAAEDRLKSYFFEPALWSVLPEKARRSLVEADRTWFSPGAGRVESVLEDLRVATESLLYLLLWGRLRKASGGQGLLAFAKADRDLQQEGHHPSLKDYIWLCQQSFFKAFVDSLTLPDEDRRLLLTELPRALTKLRVNRNPAQHEPLSEPSREEVLAVHRYFVGINRTGLLPRLVEVERKLRVGRHL